MMRAGRWHRRQVLESGGRRARVIVSLGHRRLVYQGRWQLAALATMLSVAAVVVGVTFGQLIVAMSALVVVAAWLAYAMRVQRPVAAGPWGDGRGPAPGAGVREPRRPLPKSPAGAAERPLPVV